MAEEFAEKTPKSSYKNMPLHVPQKPGGTGGGPPAKKRRRRAEDVFSSML